MKIFKWLGLAIVCAAALSAMGAAPSRAATIYTYTGNSFNEVTGVYTTSDSVSGWFELASPLGNSTAYTDITANLLAFTFSDGIHTFSSGVEIDGFAIQTDNSGLPNRWFIGLETDSAAVSTSALSFLGCLSLSECIDIGQVGGNGDFGLRRADPGSWTVATTPLPAALPLFAGGLGALGLLGWRRKRKNIAALAAA